jgi:hypothetical protein
MGGCFTMNPCAVSSVFLRSMRTLTFLVLAWLLSLGCVGQQRRPLPPPMSEDDAVQLSESWCTSHGYRCMAPRVGQRGDVVEVVSDAEGQGRRGPLRLEFGSWDRRLVRVEVPEVSSVASRPAEQGG